MPKLKRAVIKEELVALTGSFEKAIILNQFIYWSERVGDFDNFIEEEKKRLLNHKYNIGDIECSSGWLYKSADQLSGETMLNLSHQTMRRHISKLVDEGFISQRQNPKYKWDKTLQYRVNILYIQAKLMKIGYSLDGYSLSKMDDQALSCGLAIPETTTETTNIKDNIKASISDEIGCVPVLAKDELDFRQDVLEYYTNLYFEYTGKEHPYYKRELLNKCFDDLGEYVYGDIEIAKSMIDDFFESVPAKSKGKKRDMNFALFCNPEMLDIRSERLK